MSYITSSNKIFSSSNQIILGTSPLVTLNIATPSVARTYTIPDAGTDASIILSTGTNQTITGGLSIAGSGTFSQAGSTTGSAATFYSGPASTALSGSSNYYFNYFDIPPTTGSTTGSAYNLYIAGAPANASNSYSLYVATGNSLISPGLNISGNTTTTGSLSGALLNVASGNIITLTNNATNFAANTFGTPLFANTNSGASGTAYNVYINGAPGTSGLNQAISTSYALFVNGLTRFTGKLQASPVGTFTTASSLGGVILQANGTTLSMSDNGDFSVYGFSSSSVDAGSVQTTGNGYSVYISGPPAGINNETITNPYALGIGSGNVIFKNSKLTMTAIVPSTSGGLGAVADFNTTVNITGTVSDTSFVRIANGSQITASTTPQTINNAYSLLITNAPVAGTGVTINNAYALYVAGGNTRLNSGVSITGSTTTTGSLTGAVFNTINNQVITLTNLATNFAANTFGTPLFANTNSGASGTAYNVYINGAPGTSGTNQAISTSYALFVNGLTRIAGKLQASPTGTFTTASSTGGVVLQAGGVALSMSDNGDFAAYGFSAPSVDAGSSQTTVNGYTVYITGQPTTTGNETITNPYALGVNGPTILKSGAVTVGGTVTSTNGGFGLNINSNQNVSLNGGNISIASVALINVGGSSAISSTTASTVIGTAASLWINAPGVGSNVAITNSYAIYTASGNIRYTSGQLAMVGVIQSTSGGFGAVADFNSSINIIGTVSDTAFVRITNGSQITATTTPQTINNAYSLYIPNAPVAGTGVTITNPYAIFTGGGNVKFTSSQTSLVGSVTNSLGGNGASLFINNSVSITGTAAAADTQLVFIAVPTFSSLTTSTTMTNAYTFYIAGAPVAGTNISSFTNSYAFFVNSGVSKFNGSVTVSGGITASGSTAIDFSGNSGAFKTTTGTTTINGPLSNNVQTPITANTTLDFTANKGSTVMIPSNPSGTITLTLPAITANPSVEFYIVHIATAGTTIISVANTGTESFDNGATTITLTNQYDRVRLKSLFNASSPTVKVWLTG